MDYNVIHIKSLDIPVSSPKKDKDEATSAVTPVVETALMEGIEDHGDVPSILTDEPTEATPVIPVESSAETGKSKQKQSEHKEPWPDRFTAALTPFLSEEAVEQVKIMFLEGSEPPRVSDNGWGGRPARPSDADTAEASNVPEPTQEILGEYKGRRGKDRNNRGGRGGRGGRAGGRREDTRKVLSDVRLSCHVYYCTTT